MSLRSFATISLLALASTRFLSAQAVGHGGTVLATFATTQPRCSAFNYYMPVRVYDDSNFTSEIDSVLASNNSDGAQRANIAVYWRDLNPSNPCDAFYVDSTGALPSELASNFTALMNSLASKGYWEVIVSLLPDNDYVTQCSMNPSMWCGSSTAWGSAQQAIYQTNLTFITNFLSYAFQHSNNAGRYVEAVLPPSSMSTDTNCAHYDFGYCGNLLHHYQWGLEAKYMTMLWDALAATWFYDGSSWFQGKNQIYGFETGYDIHSPAFQSIPTLYTVPGTGIIGLYDQTSASRPNAIAIGSYPNSQSDAQTEFTTIDNLLTQAGTTSGVIIIETYYNNAAVAAGFEAGSIATGRLTWFLLQWPWNGSYVLPSRFNSYYAYGF